jgi:hypothetical protein
MGKEASPLEATPLPWPPLVLTGPDREDTLAAADRVFGVGMDYDDLIVLIGRVLAGGAQTIGENVTRIGVEIITDSLAERRARPRVVPVRHRFGHSPKRQQPFAGFANKRMFPDHPGS